LFTQLGEKFAEDSSVVIAMMDATANELEHTKINSFPTIKLYKKGDNTVSFSSILHCMFSHAINLHIQITLILILNSLNSLKMYL